MADQKHQPRKGLFTDAWPVLPLADWQETYDTLQRWLQIVGKIRLQMAPMANHWWQAALYVTARGLTTSTIPYGTRIFEINFDFFDHLMIIETGEGKRRIIALKPASVADFYTRTVAALHSLGINPAIWTVPVEVPERTPFERDTVHAAYDKEYAQRWWRIMAQADRVLKIFRSRFIGKVSPVHFFWGSFDLAVTRFSGRRAPKNPGAPNVGRSVMIEAYSHEVSSSGFWPGAGLGEPAFYSYTYPEPAGFADASVRPAEAYYDRNFREFLLTYETVRRANDPDAVLLSFLESTYVAAANLAKWDRASLESDDGAAYRGGAV